MLEKIDENGYHHMVGEYEEQRMVEMIRKTTTINEEEFEEQQPVLGQLPFWAS